MSEAEKPMNMQAVLRRLKKIMALSKSSEPGEAAAALHQAEKLMARYKLSTEDVAMSEIHELMVPTKYVEICQVDRCVASAVKLALGVELFLSVYQAQKGRTRPKGSIVFVGDKCRTEIAKYAFETLRRQLLKSMEEEFADQNSVKGRKSSQRAQWEAKRKDAYAIGWCAAVRSKVRALAPEPDPNAKAYLLTKQLIDRTEADKNALSRIKDDARMAQMLRTGYAQGGKANLHHGVGAAIQPTLAIEQPTQPAQ